MSDRFLLLIALSILNLAFLTHIWICGRCRARPDQSAASAVEHAKEMVLIDMRRREHLLDIRLKLLERSVQGG